MAKDALTALTQTLTEKMRAKFATLAQDVVNQEVIAQEVMAFMTQGGSVKVEDVTRLEENIRLKLTGDKPKKRTWHKKVSDEWTQIAMYEISEHQKAQEQKTTVKNKNKTELRALLDEQVQERKAREAHEKEEAARFHLVEEEALGKWREQEKHKQKKRVDAAMVLKLERDEQLHEQKILREQEKNRKTLEEEEVKRQILADLKKQKMAHEDARMRQKEDMRRLQESNLETRAMRQKLKEDETALELQYQAEYSRILEKQEAKRLEALTHFKEKQNRQEAAGTSVGEYKRWISDDIIKSNFERYESMKDEEERRRKEKVLEMNRHVKEVLDQQVMEKKMKKEKMDEVEKQRVGLSMAKLALEKEKEKEKSFQRLQQRLHHKKELEEQMRLREAAKLAKQGSDMSHIERSLNSEKLGKAKTGQGQN